MHAGLSEQAGFELVVSEQVVSQQVRSSLRVIRQRA
jgi:hypothetical protein